jgi:hypothetical protein
VKRREEEEEEEGGREVRSTFVWRVIGSNKQFLRK